MKKIYLVIAVLVILVIALVIGAHNGVAALLLLSVVTLLRFLWTPKTLR